jgi:hypothetical protein
MLSGAKYSRLPQRGIRCFVDVSMARDVLESRIRVLEAFMMSGKTLAPLRRRALIVSFLVGGLLLLQPVLLQPTGSLRGQETTKLYLKDGTYQLVKTYEIRGDRVRFYSVERSEWEEVPLALIDLDATRRAKKEDSAQVEKAIEKAQELEKEHFDRPADAGPEVAPGVHLPPEEGIYSYDGLRLIRLIQSNGEIVTDKKRMVLNLATPAPIFKNRQFVVLPGTKAAVRMPNPKPTFFAQFADGLGGRLQLIRVKSGKQDRVVENIETRFRPTHASESRATLALDYAQVGPRVFRLTPLQPLLPGEYAFAELIQGKLNLDLWDFGIDGNTKAPKSSQPGSARPVPMSEEPPEQVPQSPKPKTSRPPIPPLPDSGQSPRLP